MHISHISHMLSATHWCKLSKEIISRHVKRLEKAWKKSDICSFINSLHMKKQRETFTTRYDWLPTRLRSCSRFYTWDQTYELLEFNRALLCPQARTSLLFSGNARISSFIVRLVINFSLSEQVSGIKPEPADTQKTHCSYSFTPESCPTPAACCQPLEPLGKL